MFVKFNNLKFKNILSYGNNENVVNFEPGMTLISGKNGNGKCVRRNTVIKIKATRQDTLLKWYSYTFNKNSYFSCKSINEEFVTTVGDVSDFYRIYPACIGHFEVSTRFGYKTIEFACITSFNSDIIRIETENRYIETSPDHLLFVSGKWIQTKFLKKGDTLETEAGLEKIKKTSRLDFVEDLYDLQVQDVHEFFANGVVSHNSTMIDALSFCLYGKPYRKIRINDLINRRNRKKLYTECNFTIGDDEYKIVRTLQPNSIEMWKNGVETEKLSSKKLNQEEINKIIGLDYSLFRNIIALSINYNKAFLALEIAEKRDIIESIFNIKIFAEMLKKLKTNNSNLKVQNQVNISQISILETTIKTLANQIKNVEKTKSTFDSDKAERIKELNLEFSQKQEHYKQLQKENKELAKKIAEIESLLDTTDFSHEASELNTLIKLSVKQFNDNLSKIELFDNNAICPDCGSVLDHKHKIQEITRLNSENDKLKNDVSNAKNNKSELANRYRINEDRKSEITKYKNKITTNNNEIEHIKRTAVRINSDIKKENERIFDFDDVQLKSDYESKKNDYTAVHSEYVNIADDIKYNDFALNILSDQGIKAFFFKRLVPILNQKINGYLDIFELPLQINFNDMMEENITMIGSKENISYMSFSEGEKKRIDIAIMLSFIDTTKVISNWNCNLLAFDEILDSSTDSDGLDKIMGAVKQMTIEQTNLCCYIISHRDNDHENYTRKIIVKKVGGFSSINA